MKSTKKKIVALSTAFVMAFALVAAMLPTVSKADGQKYIYPDGFIGTGAEGEAEAHGNYMANIPGTSEYSSIKVDATSKTVTFAGITITGGEYTGISFYSTDGWTLKFTGTNSVPEIMDGQNLTVSVGDDSVLSLSKFRGGFSLAEGTKADKDISNASFDNPVENVTFTGPTGGGGSTDPVPVKAGDNQTVTPGSPVVISFDKEFSKFENGGAVFLDESTEPLSTDCFKATSGSTVITLLDSFTKTLKEGAHTLKVKFNDDSVGTATFTVSASANSDGSASGTSGTATSGTATSGTSSSAATTTKVAAPKTADVLPFAAIAVVFVGATAIGVIAFRRKNS